MAGTGYQVSAIRGRVLVRQFRLSKPALVPSRDCQGAATTWPVQATRLRQFAGASWFVTSTRFAIESFGSGYLLTRNA